MGECAELNGFGFTEGNEDNEEGFNEVRRTSSLPSLPSVKTIFAISGSLNDSETIAKTTSPPPARP
jgi:hypothetical protein